MSLTCADNLDFQQLEQQTNQFLEKYQKSDLSVNGLSELEKNSQDLIKALQNCEKKAEQEIAQLVDIREIDALKSDAKDGQDQGSQMLPQSAATQEVDRQINVTTKRLIACRLKSGQMEEARFALFEKKQQLWMDELTSRQDVWSFMKAENVQLNLKDVSQILPFNIWFLWTVLLGMGAYAMVLWRHRAEAFTFKAVDPAGISVKGFIKQLMSLYAVPLVLAWLYYVWVDSNKVHAFVLFGGLLVRDAFVLLPLKLLVSEQQKQFIKPFMIYSTGLIVLLALGWNGIHFKQNIGLDWLVEYSVLITPLVILTCLLLGLTNLYFYLLIKSKKDRFVPLLILLLAVLSLLAYTLSYAQGAQYILIISVGLMLVHWQLKTINSIRKVSLVHKINHLKQQEEYDGSNFAFPFWVSLLTVLVSGLAGLVFLSWLGGVSEEAYKQVSFIYSEGFDLGSVRIVPQDILIAVVLVSLIVYVLQKLKLGIENRWFDKSRVRKSSREVFSMLIWYIGLTIAVFVGLSVAGFDISRLAIIAGALSVGIGFGLKNIVSNFVSGLILLFERPVTRGDWVEVGGTVGLIEKVKIRATRIRTFDNAEILVPNSELLSHHVTNWTLSNSIGRITIKIGVAYGSDVNQVREILNEIATSHDQVIKRDPYKHKVLFREFGDSSLNFELRVMIKDIKMFLDVETDINFAIDKALRDANISIPFPQRDIHIKDSSILQIDESNSQNTDSKDNHSKQLEAESPAQSNARQTADDNKEKGKGEVAQMIEEDEKKKEAEQKDKDKSD
ncbi:mechanosensitive ion channel domain-containing protein [Marinicella litoralis]|uniref:mechanosensitive ion channel domain-containing protein n=1 Tax=Marinicella litoralis TaxID=644220 RepID=UPI0013C31EE8|nr:mechanosensitive ion channel domain-containing protein [Marinicella litoralis]